MSRVCDTRQSPGIEIHPGHPCLWLLEMALPFGHQPALAIPFLEMEAHGTMMCGAQRPGTGARIVVLMLGQTQTRTLASVPWVSVTEKLTGKLSFSTKMTELTDFPVISGQYLKVFCIVISGGLVCDQQVLSEQAHD